MKSLEGAAQLRWVLGSFARPHIDRSPVQDHDGPEAVGRPVALIFTASAQPRTSRASQGDRSAALHWGPSRRSRRHCLTLPPTGRHRLEVTPERAAGLVAAAALARAGERVRVYEKAPMVGHRFAGDSQGLENWSSVSDTLDRLGRLGVEPTFAHRSFHQVTFYDSKMRPVVARPAEPLFYLVRTGPDPGSLDRGLLDQAQDARAEVLRYLPGRPGPMCHLRGTRPNRLHLPVGLGGTSHPRHVPVPPPTGLATGPSANRRDVHPPGARTRPRRRSTLLRVRVCVRSSPIQRRGRSPLRG